MACTVQWNSYVFPVETTVARLETSFERDGKGRLRREVQSWSIRTIIQADGDAAINSAISSLEAALRASSNPQSDPNSLRIKLANGWSTVHTLANAIIEGISYPEGTGPEFANRRTVEIKIRGDAEVDRSDRVISFSERVAYSGGGSEYTMLTSLTGLPQRYKTIDHAVYRATQSGSITAENRYEDPPSPLWRRHLTKEPNIEYSTSRTPYGEKLYHTSYSYEFASARRLDEEPHVWV